MQPKVAEPAAQAEPELKERDYAAKLGSISSSIMSVGDLFRDMRDGSKVVRFPKDTIKVLEQKLQDIAMGKDPACAPPVFVSPKFSLAYDVVATATTTSLYDERWPCSTAKSRTRRSDDR